MKPTSSYAVMSNRIEAVDSLDMFPTPPWATRALVKHMHGWLRGGNRMPFHRFQIEVQLPQHRVMERIRSLGCDQPSVRQWFGEMRKRKLREWFCEQRKPRDSALPPFIGRADADSFRMHRRIRGRNPALPLIRGHVLPIPTGTQINVTMFMSPPVVVILTFWVGLSGAIAIVGLWQIAIVREGYIAMLATSAFMLFFVALQCGEFFLEASKAKRILTDAFSDSKITP
jgi:hypothetical protein